MNGRHKILCLAIGFVLMAPCFMSAEDVIIQVRLFRGTWDEAQEGLKQDVILSTSSTPMMASLKAKADGPVDELTAAVIETLMDVMDLRTVDDMFSFAKTWNEKDPSLSHKIRQKLTIFWFFFTPKRLSPQKVELQTVVFKSKEAPLRAGESYKKALLKLFSATKSVDQMEKILGKELILEIGDPLIVGIPSKGCTYFLMILLTRGSRDTGRGVSFGAETQVPTVFLDAVSPVHKVMPAYPDELRQQGVEGKVQLQLIIDEEGIVQGVKVVKSLHPYLDNAAVQALRQWKFEPVLQNGKPVPVAITMAVNFNRESYRLQEETPETKESPSKGLDPSSQAKLRMILDQCSEYCRKLSGSVLDFICEETIKEIHFNFMDEETAKNNMILVLTGPTPSASWMTRFDPERTERNKFVCEYMFVKKGEKIEERRILLKENGHKMTDRKKLLEEKRFSVLNPLFATIRLLDQDRQPLFTYRLLKEEKVEGKKAHVIEVMPKSGDAGGILYAKIWVDKKSFQILKSKIEGVPLEGYEDVLKDTTMLNIKPVFTTTYLYQIKKKGILFPSRSTVRVAYPGLSDFGRKVTKLKIDMTYKKYKFFTVDWEHKIKKGDTADCF